MKERDAIEDIITIAEIASNTQCLELQRELVTTIAMINRPSFVVSPADIPLKPGHYYDTTYPFTK